MKKLALLLPFLVLLYACDNTGGGGATASKPASLNTLDDSMFYAFAASLVKGVNTEGVAWDSESFASGVNDMVAGASKLDMNAAMQQIQAFGQEVSGRQGRAITAEDGLSEAINMGDVSYAYGAMYVQQLNDIDMSVKPDAFISGFSDAVSGINALGDEMALQVYTDKFRMAANEKAMAKRQEEMAKREAEMAEQAGPNKEAGAAFMAENKGKAGVVQHESGMQYKVLKKGDGKGQSPTVQDKVTIHYTGRLLDGTEFDSSQKTPESEPVTFPLSNLIKGWQIALPMMKPGDKWTIWLPSDIAYGNSGNPRIPPGSTLEFDIEYFGIGQ